MIKLILRIDPCWTATIPPCISPTAGRKEVSLQTATTVDTKVNTAETTHINVTGTLRTVTGGNLTIKLKTASGTVTPKAGSSFEFRGKIDNDIGNTV